MDNHSKVSGIAVVAVVIAVIALGTSILRMAPASPSNVGGERGGLQEFIDGAKIGDTTSLWKKVTIGPGANQGYWKNTLGKTVYLDIANTSIGFHSGTASSSLNFYVATSSSATLTDYVTPSGTLPLSGARVATSTTGDTTFMGTTTSAGTGFAVPAGSYVIFDIQEAYNCKTATGLCETATSTNRGITNFFGSLRIYY